MCDAANADANASSLSPSMRLMSGFNFLKILENSIIPYPKELAILYPVLPSGIIFILKCILKPSLIISLIV